MAEVIFSPVPVILFIDEAHTLIGAGNQQGGLDISNLLKPALARGELKNHRRHHLERVQKIFRERCSFVAPLPVSEGQRTQRCRNPPLFCAVCRRSMNSLTAC